nr:hypothetical protein EATA8330_31400 [Enterobacter asburiae]
MAINESELIDEVKERIKQYYINQGKPYLISTLGIEFKNIKEIINKKKVLEWVKLNLESLDAELYQSENKKEFIGLLPKNKNSLLKKTPSNEKYTTLNSRKNITISFLTILSNLNEEDRRRVNIPTDIIIKLLGER